jgi:hypothetical protein
MGSWSILQPVGIFYDHLVYFMIIWYILWSYGIFFLILVCCSKKNLATLRETEFPLMSCQQSWSQLPGWDVASEQWLPVKFDIWNYCARIQLSLTVLSEPRKRKVDIVSLSGVGNWVLIPLWQRVSGMYNSNTLQHKMWLNEMKGQVKFLLSIFRTKTI